MKDDRVYLLHILECTRRIEDDTAGGKNALLSSHTLQDAALTKGACGTLLLPVMLMF